MTTQEPTRLNESAQLLKVLGNSYRLHIVRLLFSGEKNVTELNREVKVSQPALSQHLSKLRKEGVVDCRRDQRQIYYYLKNPHIVRIVGVVDEAVAGSVATDVAVSA